MSPPGSADQAFASFVDDTVLADEGAGLERIEPLTRELYQHADRGDAAPGEMRLTRVAPLGLTRLWRLDYERTLRPDSTGTLQVTLWRDDQTRYFVRVSGGCVVFDDCLYGPYHPRGEGFLGPSPRSGGQLAPPVTPPPQQPQVSAVSLAILCDDLAGAERALRDHPDEVNALDGNGMSALHYALSTGRGAAVKLLLSSGADADLTSRTGLTPLLIAVSRQDLELTSMLLEAGADPNAPLAALPATIGLLDYARCVGRTDLVELLERHRAR